jgi:hypothetical protein
MRMWWGGWVLMRCGGVVVSGCDAMVLWVKCLGGVLKFSLLMVFWSEDVRMALNEVGELRGWDLGFGIRHACFDFWHVDER